MPIVHSVSDITSILSGIIQNAPTLQNVRVQGIISPVGSGAGYLLGDEKNQIWCFIAPPIPPKFTTLLKGRASVVVHGKIGLFPLVNQYQILVQDIQPLRNGDIRNQSLSVSEITTELSNLIENQNELQDIRIQGEILHGPPGLPNFILTLGDCHTDNTDLAPRIQCILPNNMPQEEVGNEIHVRGKIKNFDGTGARYQGTGVRYQIVIDDIEPIPFDNEEAKCKCSGCDECLPLLGSNLLCNRLGNPYLCSKCHAVNRNPEDKVVRAVNTYFSHFQGFTTVRECEIQMGVDHRSADIVLVNREGIFVAIGECKRNKVVAYGPAQLKSYLCATDTRFGVFANTTDQNSWVFYENLRHNRFQQIDRSQFEKGVVEGIITNKELEVEIKKLEKKKENLETDLKQKSTENQMLTKTERDLQFTNTQLIAKIGKKRVRLSELETEIGKLAKAEHDLQNTRKKLSDEIGRKTAEHANLERKITGLRKQKSKLETEVKQLEQRENKLHTYREQRKEKLQKIDQLIADLQNEDLNSHSQTFKDKGIVSKLKNLFSKENE